MSDFKNLSRKDFMIPSQEAGGKPTFEEIKLSLMMRLADAAEAMAKNYNLLIYENSSLKRRNERLEAEAETLKKRSASYKGKYLSAKAKLKANNIVDHDRAEDHG